MTGKAAVRHVCISRPDMLVLLITLLARDETVELTQAERNAMKRELADLVEDNRRGAAQARHVAVAVRRQLRLRPRGGAELGAGPPPPRGPARILLKVIEHDPDAVRRALAA